MLRQIIDDYLRIFPEDRDGLDLLMRQVTDSEDMTDRRNFNGHITGGAIVLSPGNDKILLVHHRVLDRWLQPGGHWESDESDPLQAARREAVEETAVHIARYLPLDAARPLVPLHIGTHYIPPNPRKDEAEHYHHDFRYVFQASDELLDHDRVETHGAGWFDLDAPETAGISDVVQRLRERIVSSS